MILTETSWIRRAPALCAAMMMIGAAVGDRAEAVKVDAELLLLVDVTKSINDTEFDVIMEGFAQSFEAAATIDAIQGGVTGSIAASVVFFSDKNNQAVGVNWMQVSDAASAQAFATQLRSAVRPSDKNGMALATVLDFSTALFGTETGGTANGFESVNQVMTLVGDGIDNNSPSGGQPAEDVVLAAGQAALSSGVDIINAITIGGGQPLTDYYTQYVVGGSVGPFTGAVVDTPTVATFPALAEIFVADTLTAVVPEPNSLLLASIGSLFLLYRRRS